MASELITARKKFNAVNTMLKKGKYMSAVRNIHDGLIIMLKTSIMKSERDEFEEMLRTVTHNLNNNDDLRKIYPLVISYEPGEERKLLDALKELLKELQKAIDDDAQNNMQAVAALKEKAVQQGQSHLDKEEWSDAKKTFDALVKEFAGDVDLKADIADRYLKAGRYQEAFDMLDDALKDDPNAIHLYNRIGMVLRKMQDFDTAEKYYLKALTLCESDEYLHYNLGRLYYDWKKWNKMAGSAQRAVEINPEFGEAAKMLKFAKKQLAK